MAVGEDEAVITFASAGEWTLADARRVIDAADHAYGIFLAVRIANLRVQHVRAAANWAPPSLADYLLPNPPREQAEAGWGLDPRPGLVRTAPQDVPFGPEVRYLEYLYERRYTIAPAAQLRIQSWRMASPGHISLVGLGDVVLQLRELIKNLTYRNRQEEALGELEIARRRLELERSAVSAPAIDYMSTRLLAEVHELEQLEAEGKIILFGNVDQLVEQIAGSLAVTAQRWPEAKTLVRKVRQLQRHRKNWRETADQVGDGISGLINQQKIGTADGEHLLELLTHLHQLRRSEERRRGGSGA